MLKESPLGQPTVYIENYSPELLFPIPRSLARDKIKMGSLLPFNGVDIWSGFELSWLNPKGKPMIALAEFKFPCTSLNVVESKSFKLYLNSFNQSRFSTFEEVKKIIQTDLSNAAQANVEVDIFPLSQCKTNRIEDFQGLCLDDLDIEVDVYLVEKTLLKTSSEHCEESIYSNLLKSNCLATGQPDWGSIFIRYSGPKIDHESLLKYIISFRRHSGFGEHCVEQIYYDILTECKPKKLTVYGRYTRRGGLDINPFRSNFENVPENTRQTRQ